MGRTLPVIIPQAMVDLLPPILDALVANVDAATLRAELRRRLGDRDPSMTSEMPALDATPHLGAPSAKAQAVLKRLVMEDILDEAILHARPQDREFPLRILFGQLGESLDDDGGFALASALSFYFRVPMEEETKVRVGIETSRLYYLFCEQMDLGREIVRQASPLLSALMSTQLEKTRFESVDHLQTFDSQVHERDTASIRTSPVVRWPRTFLVRIKANGMVRSPALVRT
jgi:hypothetical protein